ncbi:hypothetical protein predicted by Glimmer/Critica [Ruminococcus bicirculans (ex Wegman et al. 2014)]|uniref:Transposase n=1 Tax=Ruminococcus bicirculans (ex Wegman et al. 2014) TaxID=1160721 RepID=A0ABM9QDW6_9FIRM|nr:hypothetical protein predicted by Glimmer/Critica [Ruminococcus bicirculans (ex Wegman et al. 2014)]
MFRQLSQRICDTICIPHKARLKTCAKKLSKALLIMRKVWYNKIVNKKRNIL